MIHEWVVHVDEVLTCRGGALGVYAEAVSGELLVVAALRNLAFKPSTRQSRSERLSAVPARALGRCRAPKSLGLRPRSAVRQPSPAQNHRE